MPPPPSPTLIDAPHVPRFPLRRPSAVILALAALLASCGGSSSSTSSNQVEPFKPNRIISFGDETSAILTDGRHFGVNGLNPETRQFDCTLNPTWNQQLASSFGMIYAQCNPTAWRFPRASCLPKLATACGCRRQAGPVSRRPSRPQGPGDLPRRHERRDRDLPPVSGAEPRVADCRSQGAWHPSGGLDQPHRQCQWPRDRLDDLRHGPHAFRPDGGKRTGRTWTGPCCSTT